MLRNLVKLVGGDPNKRAIQNYDETVEQVNALEERFEQLSREELQAKTAEFRQRLAEGETLDELLPEAFAAVREASKRTLGLRPYDVQVMGAAILHDGRVVEMRTGEGKTLSATMPLYLNALEGKGAHLVTVNDYLARRDARWMAPIYNLLGMSVGVLQMSQSGQSGRHGLVVDLQLENSQEDQHQLRQVDRSEAYQADITYGTNNEFGFDYLRDNMKMNLADKAQRGHHYAIIDEVDNVLIDEARTPLIISGPAQDQAEEYYEMAKVVKRLNPEDYEINEKDRNVSLTEIGETHLEQLLGVALRDPERPEDITPEQARTLGFVEQAMRAQHLFKRNKDYLVQGGKVVIIDEFTGRLMPGRRWSDGLHQAVEAKEGVKVESENVTYATITIQNYFRMYDKLAGMTGTAMTEAQEFSEIYELDALALPSNVEYNATGSDAPLVELQDKDRFGYEYTYYARREDEEQKPYLWKRKDYPDVVYRTVEAKMRAIVREILVYHVIGRPVLVGTTSVENSDMLSTRLRADMVQRLLQTLLIRDVWMEQNKREEDGRAIPELADLNEPLDKLQIAELRRYARDLDINLNLQSEENMPRLLAVLGLKPEHEGRLQGALQGGIAHEVLNARRHTEESQIIAGAGAFGAVTIATNMAGRGVDIKLGGEIAEEVLASVSRVLRRAGHDEPYEMSLEAQRDALQQLDEDDYGIYKSEIKYFLKSMDEMAKVKELGGLHVIGSERHDARRIDNQLRGRAARQGDPGSSRFFLSMQDDLMRLFGGQQVEGLMARMGVDDAVPLEMGLVSRIIEQSQSRVEGANFDARKHLLEYDDVLNSQRATVYAQRDRIMTKDDLSDDVAEMLETEVNNRVPMALADEDGPWKLLAWLDQIQPSMVVNRVLIPSFTYQLLIDSIKDKTGSREEAKAALVEIAAKAIDAEEEHHLRNIEGLLESNRLRLENTLDERLDSLDIFVEGLGLADETDTRSPAELLEEVSSLMHTPIKLDSNQQRLLREDPDEAANLIESQLAQSLRQQAVMRLIGAVERRLDRELDLEAQDLADSDWDGIEDAILAAVRAEFATRRESLLGENGRGEIGKDVSEQLSQANGDLNQAQVLNALLSMPRGTVMVFDKKTHRPKKKQTTRLSYSYYAAKFIEDMEDEAVTEKVLKHLQGAQQAMETVWGLSAWAAVAPQKPGDLNEFTRSAIEGAVGEEALQGLNGDSLSNLPQETQQKALRALGQRGLSETYRQLLLRVISELWVEYLTQMEALRIAVRLESYAQRDPLVEYKAQAFRMFQQLFDDMRSTVVNRMFTYRPRSAQQAAQRAAMAEAPPEMTPEEVQEASGNGAQEEAQEKPQQEKQKSGGRKRRRRRRG